MIYQKPGETFFYNGTAYTVGASILANNNSAYHGLFGRILEITTDEDQDTDNKTPDIHCSFDVPVLSAEVRALEQTFSQLQGKSVKAADIPLDLVIMAPDMIMPLAEPNLDYEQGKLHVVVCHWSSNGESGSYEAPYTDLNDAKRQFHDDLLEERNEGCIPGWISDSQFAEEETDHSYECYLLGEYCANHYFISIEERSLPLSPAFIRTIADLHDYACAREDFQEAVSQWADYPELTEEQEEQLLKEAGIVDRLNHQLGKCDAYWEAYWDAMAEVARAILQEYQQKHQTEQLPQ